MTEERFGVEQGSATSFFSRIIGSGKEKPPMNFAKCDKIIAPIEKKITCNRFSSWVTKINISVCFYELENKILQLFSTMLDTTNSSPGGQVALYFLLIMCGVW